MDFQGIDYIVLICLYVLILLASAYILDTIRRHILKYPINRLSIFLDDKANIFT
jgi:hypothetical protein